MGDAQAGEVIRFTIPSLPASVNAIYQIIYSLRRVEMKPEVRSWKTKAKEYIPRFNTIPNTVLRVDTTFIYNWYYLNGKLRKFDTHNLLKVLCDAIAEKIGVDDSLMKEGSWRSIHSKVEELVQVEVRQGESSL